MILMATLAWVIWNERNNVFHGQNPLIPEDLLAAASSMMEVFWAACLRRKGLQSEVLVQPCGAE